MNKFNKILQEQLDQMPAAPGGIVSKAMEAGHKVKEAESVLRNAEDEFNTAIESLNNQLALEIRRRNGKLQVTLGNGKCQVYYKSKGIVVRPNAVANKWEIDPNDMGRSFLKGFAHALPMTDDLGPIAEAVVEYFTGQYKTLGDTYSRAPRAPKPYGGQPPTPGRRIDKYA